MGLKEYKQKRDFKKTAEPKGSLTNSKKPKSKKLIYCIQKHHASHLHHDLRLEMNGVLKSWAIPKEPPKEKGVKRLAIMTEDHPIGYEKFEGDIPKGQYGGGKVEIWDSGFYELKDKDSKKIEVIISGKKLKGHYVLIKTHYGAKPEKSWLFMKI
jgi:DNA ligase D-like protein (predicted 3'-phosphoesterase)